MGRPGWIEGRGVNISGLKEHIYGLRREGKTVVVCAHDMQALGIIALADTVKPGSLQAIRGFHKAGLRVIRDTGAVCDISGFFETNKSNACRSRHVAKQYFSCYKQSVAV